MSCSGQSVATSTDLCTAKVDSDMNKSYLQDPWGRKESSIDWQLDPFSNRIGRRESANCQSKSKVGNANGLPTPSLSNNEVDSSNTEEGFVGAATYKAGADHRRPPQAIRASTDQMATCIHRWGTLFILVVTFASSYLSTVDATGEPRKLEIAIPIYENMTMLDAVGPYEILQTLPFVNVVFVSFERGPISDLGTMTMEAKAAFHEVPSPDVVVMPGGLGARGLTNNTVILNWLRKAHESTVYTTSVCTGALLMGAAGLLKGIDATTHWDALPSLADYGANPVSIRVVRRGKVITSAGVSSGIDMAIALAALLSDNFTAQVTQLSNEYDPQPPFNTGTERKASPQLVAKAREWFAARTAQMNGTA